MFGKKKQSTPSDTPPGPILNCSFCNKSQRHVKKMIAGPDVQICNECVDICLDILNHAIKEDGIYSGVQGRVDRVERAWPTPGSILFCALCGLPSPIEHSVTVPERGVICAGCAVAVAAAVAARELSE